MCLGDKIHDASECLDLDRCRCVWGRQGERVCGVQPGGCAWVTRSTIQDPGSIAWTWTVAGGAGGERMGARLRGGISWANVLDLDRYRA